MKILVTGGLGYIGSHTVCELLQQNYEVLVVDNLSNADLESLDRIQASCGKRPEFEVLELCDAAAVDRYFKAHPDIQGIIHFAAFKAVGESVLQPLKYYQNNLNSLIHILEGMQHCTELPALVFSSSCTVYGQADQMPITEEAPFKPAASPYGQTKQMNEQILQDFAHQQANFSGIALRYFNPIGAHPSGNLGEIQQGKPEALLPFITQTAYGMHPELVVFGDDYDTRDGSCIRDYIHIMDLVEAHIAALNYLAKRPEKGLEAINVGTGIGTTVLEMIRGFEEVNGVELPYRIGARRPGDVIKAYAQIDKAQKLLGWEPRYSLQDALKTAWAWEQKLRS